jgi:predicted transcriptional regulator
MIANYSDAMAELRRTAAENERLHKKLETLKARYHELDTAYSEECLRSSNQEDRIETLEAVLVRCTDDLAYDEEAQASNGILLVDRHLRRIIKQRDALKAKVTRLEEQS